MKRNELKELLTEHDDLSSRRLFVWGTGNTASLYLQGFRRLENEGIVIEGFCDNNSEKWGTSFGGRKVYSPNEICDHDDALILIASPQPKVFKSISTQLDDMNMTYRHIDDYIFKTHRNELLRVYDLLEDERSREVYSELIKCRMEGTYPKAEMVDEGQYFPTVEFGAQDKRRVFVDCGAYVGDSIEKYIWKNEGCFEKIYAFEPDPGNLKALNYRLERLKREWNLADDKIEVYPCGVSNEDSVRFVDRYEVNNGFGSKLQDERTDKSEECKIVSVDKVIDREYTFLKADIESYEYNMLLGAENTIKRYMPKMAICIYHNAVDFYSIPLLINSYSMDYRMSVRHYTDTVSDTVLYVYL